MWKRLAGPRKEESFFPKKKNQKDFCSWGYAVVSKVPPIDKSFCFLFKKKCFLPVDASASRQLGIIPTALEVDP
jgi:hypothetical protein